VVTFSLHQIHIERAIASGRNRMTAQKLDATRVAQTVKGKKMLIEPAAFMGLLLSVLLMLVQLHLAREAAAQSERIIRLLRQILARL
jgi:hypothetical protein